MSYKELKYEEVKIDASLIEQKEKIDEILDKEGLILLAAPTGTGKTYTIANLFLEKSKRDNDRVFVILCPNRIQNQQNAEQYGLTAVIAGVEISEKERTISCVYEKIDEIIKVHKNKRLTIVVDEAHELIDSINYREKSVTEIDRLKGIAYNVIHVTATSRKLKQYYHYDYEYKFEFKEKKDTLNLLNIIPTDDIDNVLFNIIKLNKQNNKQSLVFLNGSLESVKSMGEVLNKYYKVGVITRNDKQSFLYKNIVEKSVIPNELDVIVSTKVLECGTNINNNNIVPIEVIKNSSFFNLDSTEQKFARLRKHNEYGFVIIKKKEQTEKEIKNFEQIKSNINFALEKTIQALKRLEYKKNKNKIDDIDKSNYEISNALNSHINPIASNKHSNLLKVVKQENGKCKYIKNNKKIINEVYKIYDKQFLLNLSELKTELQKRIKAKDIKIITFELSDQESIDAKAKLKDNIKKNKDIKEKNKHEVKNIILETNLHTLEEYLQAQDKYHFLEFLKKDKPTEFENILKIKEQDTELKKIEKLYQLQEFNKKIEDVISYYEKHDTEAEMNRYIKHSTYLHFNRIFTTDIPSVYSSYSIIRKHFDEVKNKKGRITQKNIFTTMKELYEKKALWQFDAQRVKEDYEKFLAEKNKEKRNKIGKRIIKKFIQELNIIYNITEDSNGYIITSLKK